MCPQQVIDWAESRHFFYWRLRRRLLEHRLKKKMKQFLPGSSQAQMDSMLSRWFVEGQGTINVSFGCDVLASLLIWFGVNETVKKKNALFFCFVY